MLSAHCSRHGRTVLVTPSAIDAIDNTASGFLVRWHCTCGEHSSTVVPRQRPMHPL